MVIYVLWSEYKHHLQQKWSFKTTQDSYLYFIKTQAQSVFFLYSEQKVQINILSEFQEHWKAVFHLIDCEFTKKSFYKPL